MTEPEPQHNPDAYELGWDAWQMGYDDAAYEGAYDLLALPCPCAACRQQYQAGQLAYEDEHDQEAAP